MAASLLSQKGPRASQSDSAPLVAVIVGADRVAANGDTANKIGTYGLAVLARWHGVKFLVAAPRTTIDLKTKSGAEIVIEERKEREMLVVKGPVVKNADGLEMDVESAVEVGIAAKGTKAWNPAFDVTPAELVDGVVTEVGVAVKGKDGDFGLQKVMGLGMRERRMIEEMEAERMPAADEGP